MPFATPDLCDEFGAEVHVAEPLFRDFGGVERFAGPIATLRVFEDNALVRQALEMPGAGRVLVVDGGGSSGRPWSAATSPPWHTRTAGAGSSCMAASATPRRSRVRRSA